MADEGSQDDYFAEDDGHRYKVVKFVEPNFWKPVATVRTGLTLGEARAHCNDPSTKGPGWFHGFTKE